MNHGIFKITILMVLFLSLWGIAVANESTIVGKITYLSGKARIKNKDEIKWNKLQNNMNLYDGQIIETDTQSRCEIHFRGKSIVRINEYTRVEMKENTSRMDKVKIEDGDIWLAHLLPEAKSAIEIETPSSACSIRGTVYRLSCNTNQTTYRCYKGTITIKPIANENQINHNKTFLIGKGEELILVKNFAEYINEQKREFNDFINEKMDDFEQYNQEQMRSFNESVNSDMENFKKMNGYYVSHKAFDEKQDSASDWVRWNMERDKKRMSGLPQKVNSLRLNP
jgi:FecR protein